MPFSPRQKGLIFFGLTIFLAIFIAVWIIFLNKGQLIIMAEPPYTVEISGAPAVICQTNPCNLKLIPHNYKVQFKKPTFFIEERDINIQRWQTLRLTVNFKLIPKIAKLDKVEPLNLANINNNVWQLSPSIINKIKTPLANLPPYPKSILFSPLGNFALIDSLNQMFLYEISRQKYQALELSWPLSVVWSEDEKTIYYLPKFDNLSSQNLTAFKPDKKEVSKITSFPRPIQKADLFLSPLQKKIIILDQTESPLALYLIDLTKAAKKRLLILDNIVALKWSAKDTNLLLEQRNNRSRLSQLSWLNLSDNELQSLDIKTTLAKAVWLDDSRLIIASNQKFNFLNYDSKAFLETVKDQFWPADISETFIIYDTVNKTLSYFVEPNQKEVYHPERLFLEKSDRSLYFVQEENWYRIPFTSD